MLHMYRDNKVTRVVRTLVFSVPRKDKIKNKLWVSPAMVEPCRYVRVKDAGRGQRSDKGIKENLNFYTAKFLKKNELTKSYS